MKQVRSQAPGLVAWAAIAVATLLPLLGASRPVPPRVPHFKHVFVLVLENEDFHTVIGSPAMPYLNGLASRYGLATNYYANSHPSIGNYFMMTTGQIITRDDSYSETVAADNIVRRLLAAGKTWKSYAEDLPQVGYVGGNRSPYVRRHNPLSFLSDVVEDNRQRSNLVPVQQLAADLASDNLPDYGFIVPNMYHDVHSCPPGVRCSDTYKMHVGDDWLKENLEPLITSKSFQQDGLLLILFDEADNSDRTNGGGKIPAIVVSAKVRSGFKSDAFYQHQSALRLTCEALGIGNCPGAAATAPSMAEFFEK